MEKLSSQALQGWVAKCPEDIRAFVAFGEECAEDGMQGLVHALQGATPLDVPDLLRTDPDGCQALGRIGRMRLLAWVASEGGSNGGELVRRIVGEQAVPARPHVDPDAEWSEDEADAMAAIEAGSGDEDEGSAGGQDRVGVLFLEDLREFAKSVVGPRIAARIIDNASLDATNEAAATLESDMAFTGGGV